jgi:DNA modification methylase
MTASMPELLLGDARALPLPDESVDVVVTSPPYLGLRDYGHDAQLGSEPTPAEFLDALIACTREMVRVLKPSGSIFLNLGDSYSGGRPGSTPTKSLQLVPERYRIRCVDELGLIARAVIVWQKVNSLPESVQDRVRRSHEDWVHLTRNPRYFAAVDEIRETYSDRVQQRQRYAGRDVPARSWSGDAGRNDGGGERGILGFGHAGTNPLGKLPGSVWTVATQPLHVPAELGVDHFAAFPMSWPRRLIQGWCPREVCTDCGEGRRPVAAETGRVVSSAAVRELGGTAAHAYGAQAGRGDGGTERIRTAAGHNLPKRERVLSGYACACPDTTAPASPGVVLDPFSGTGTTALVATMLGRRGIGVDLNPDYLRIAQWRANDPKERARAAGLDPDQVAAIRPQLPGQGSLLDLLGGEAS